MDVTVVNGEIMIDKFDMILGLLSMGFTIGVVLFVMVAAIRIGWKIAPWALAIGFIAWVLF
jgi:hypothetical protein